MSIIKTVPNQRVISTNKEPCNKQQLYTPINLQAMQIAMGKLSGNAFKMWCYLGKNQDRFTFALSREDAMQYCGFSKNTYTAAVNELIEKKFLKQSEQQKNYYLFYELPKEYKQE